MWSTTDPPSSARAALLLPCLPPRLCCARRLDNISAFARGRIKYVFVSHLFLCFSSPPVCIYIAIVLVLTLAPCMYLYRHSWSPCALCVCFALSPFGLVACEGCFQYTSTVSAIVCTCISRRFRCRMYLYFFRGSGRALARACGLRV